MSVASFLCRLDDLADPGSAGFDIATATGPFRVMVIRAGGRLRGYVNSCPHTRGPLDFEPGRFLDLERRHILCSLYGALFAIDDGACLAGPCQGRGLTPVLLNVEKGEIHLVGEFRPDSG